MKHYKAFAACLFAVALILSHCMCVHVAFAYCDMLWGIEYAGYSAPAYVVFFFSIPYLAMIVVALAIALLIWKKGKQNTEQALVQVTMHL